MYKKYKPWIIIGVVAIMILSVVMMVVIGRNGNDYYGYDYDEGYSDNGYYEEDGVRDEWGAQPGEINDDIESAAGSMEKRAMKVDTADMLASNSQAPAPSVVEYDLEKRPVYAGEIIEMVKKDGTIVISGEKPVDIYSQAKQRAFSVGGSVSNYNSETSTYNGMKYQTITCTLVVPTSEFSQVFDYVLTLGEEKNSNINEVKVTEEYYGLKDDLNNRKRAIAELEKIYAKAKNVEDSLSVYYQIQDIQREVDRIQGKMNYLQTVSSESRIHMTITQPDEDSVTPPTTSRFMRGLQRLWNDIQDGVIWLIGFLIMLVFIGIVVFLLVLLGIFIYRKVKSSLGNKQIE